MELIIIDHIGILAVLVGVIVVMMVLLVVVVGKQRAQHVHGSAVPMCTGRTVPQRHIDTHYTYEYGYSDYK